VFGRAREAGRHSPTTTTRFHMFNLKPSPVRSVCCKDCSFWLGKLAQPHVPTYTYRPLSRHLGAFNVQLGGSLYTDSSAGGSRTWKCLGGWSISIRVTTCGAPSTAPSLYRAYQVVCHPFPFQPTRFNSNLMFDWTNCLPSS
jgi:hypothetical protein